MPHPGSQNDFVVFANNNHLDPASQSLENRPHSVFVPPLQVSNVGWQIGFSCSPVDGADMSFLVLDIFRRLLEQVDEVESVAVRMEMEGDSTAAPIRR